ncbi:hypothetical protein Tco_0579509 [Tanacetum coccineum]
MSRSTLTQVYDVASAVGVFDDLEHECGQEGLDIPKKDNGIGDNADEPIDSDPFGLDSLIKQRCVKINEVKCSETPEFPPGFTPNPSINQKDSISCNKSVNGASKQHSRFSLLERLTETIKVGTALGLNMEGCETTLSSLIADNGELYMVNFLALQETKMSHIDLWALRQVWGNTHFDFAFTSARGLWVPNNVRLMWIVVKPVLSLSILLKAFPINLSPILLKDFKVDFGPTSFRFFHTWLELDGFHDLVVQTWNHDGIVEYSGFISFKKKLQNLKRVIRGWVASKRVDSNMLKLEHQSRLTLIDAKINQDCASEEDFNNRRDSMRILDDLQSQSSEFLEPKFFMKKFQRAVLGWAEDVHQGLMGSPSSSLNFWDLVLLASRKIVFIKGRNILDGPIILNEVMAWYRKRKKTLMVFKFDFEKAFDSLRWDYLDMVMVKLGFGLKWCTWIFSCLHNARSFVLVNGSPTFEFDIYDVIFLGEWSWLNTHNLLCMLRCFYLISGLKINVNKSNLLGICVPDETVSDMAYFIGCGAASFPMKYLGVRVGCTMARYSNWNTIIQKFSSKLSLWKAHLLSVGGRLSLIKSVLGHILTYYMSIYPMPSSIIKKLESMRNRFFLGGDMEERKLTLVRWNKCLASKDHGGLGIGSIYGLNIGLLFKWIWRFLRHPSDL